MNEHRTDVARIAMRDCRWRGCLDNVTELLQATGVAEGSQQRPATARLFVPSRAVGGLGGSNGRIGAPGPSDRPARTVVGDHRAWCAAGSLLDRPSPCHSVPALVQTEPNARRRGNAWP
jgi:hypothetical protein